VTKHRAPKRRATNFGWMTLSDDAFATVDDRDLVVRTLRDLKADQWAALLLTGYVGLTSGEAGQMLGMRPSTARTLATRARAAIREGR